MERIVLAFSKDATALRIKSMLDGTGYRIDNVICHSAAELLRNTADMDDLLIIMGYKLPDMVADEVMENLNGSCKLMSIVKAEHVDDIYNEDIFVLPLPLTRQRLISSIEVFLGTISKTKIKDKKGDRSPEETKLINDAKLFLMEKFHMTEQQAHRFIQKRSMDVGAKFVDTARSILDIEHE